MQAGQTLVYEIPYFYDPDYLEPVGIEVSVKDYERIPDFMFVEELEITLTPLNVSAGTYIIIFELKDSAFIT